MINDTDDLPWWERSFIVHVIQRWTIDLGVDIARLVRKTFKSKGE